MTATFEGDSNDNSPEYENVDNIVSFLSANHTPSGTKVVRMNQSYNVGPAKSIAVYPGDQVDMEVWAYYEGSSGWGNTSTGMAAFVTNVATAFGGMSGGAGESGVIYDAIDNVYGVVGMAGSQGDSQPSAYLNYILFDKDYHLLDMGWEAVPASANMAQQKISIDNISIKKAGYIFVYLSYEAESNNWVYFDDFKVTHTKTNIIQYNEYYPFGLSASTSWTREGNENNFLYNGGNELNTNTGWYEMFFRGYDPVLGRMMQVDPYATSYASHSPYNYGINNPVFFNDPNGGQAAAPPPGVSVSGWNRMMRLTGRDGGVQDFSSWYDDSGDYGGGGSGPMIYSPWAGDYSYTDKNGVDHYEGGWIDLYSDEGMALYDNKYGLDSDVVIDWGAQQGDPQTWYYMSREGTPHGMVYDPVGGYIYEINQVPDQSIWEQLEGLIINSFPSNNVKVNISVAYQYKQGSAEWSSLWAREEKMGSIFLLSPVTVNDPAAATAWFQGQTGNAWPYNLGVNNCAHYSCQGLNAGGAGINFLGPLPSSFPIAPTMTWTAGQPTPVPIGK